MTARRSAWLAARASPFLAVLVALVLLSEGAVAYDIPYRQPASDCYWWELRGVVGGGISYDVSDYDMPEWWEGVENWDSALGSLMYFDYWYGPNAKTHLRWEGEPPLENVDCGGSSPACWAMHPDWCQGGQLTEAAIYFDPDHYTDLSPKERTAVSAHEWGHNLNLGDYDPPRGYCDNYKPPRIMGWPDF